MRERIADVPRSVWAVTALFGVVLLMWVHLVPPAQAPDSAGHASLVRRLSYGESYPDYDDFHPFTGTLQTSLAYRAGLSTADRGRWLTPENAPPRGGRPSFADLGGREPWAYKNQVAQHPPLYYLAMAPVARATRGVIGGQSIEREWTVWRVVNVALVTPLPLLAWAAARRLGAPRSTAVTAAVVPLMVPQLLHIGSSVNNDNLLILLGGLLAVVLAGVARGDARSRTALAAGILTGLALLTKAHAFAFLPWIVIAHAAPLVRDRTGWRVQLRGAVIALATATVVGGWWWIRNLVRYGELNPSILDGAVQPGAGFEPDLGSYLIDWVPTFLHRFWGNLAAYAAPLPPAVVVVITAAFIASMVAAFAPRRTPLLEPVRMRRVPLAALGSVVPLLGILVLASGWLYFRETGYPAMIQGRYLFSTVVPLAVMVAVGGSRALRSRALLIALSVAVVMQGAGVWAALSGLWAEPDASMARSVRALLAWSPHPRFVIVGHLAVVVGLLLVTTAALRRDGRSDPTAA